MRLILKLLLAIGIILAAESRASALVQIDVDLASQTMHVRSGSGKSMSGRSHRAEKVMRRRGGGVPAASALHDGPLGQVRQRADAALDYLLPGNTRSTARIRPEASDGRPCTAAYASRRAAALFAMVRSQGAQIRIVGTAGGGDLAHAHRTAHKFDSALAYAPVHRSKSLNEWARDPLGR